MNRLKKEIIAAAIDDIMTSSPDSAARRYLFPPDFIGFSGHFPGHPILPAIVQLLTLVTLAGEHAGTPLVLSSVEDAKFLIPIRPEQEVLVQYRLRPIGGKPHYDAKLTVADNLAASFLVRLIPAEERA